ncbi:hypothetical protein ACJ72_05396 [Emergomyces africanus]|uniref:Uncharacterized protein n=1 Tax=Emergomyces africanus TaxID=1955775 RepID=A0A1B7NU27_9EURO|nr:hypothetical protein ACJ72_05396 [Emergomyces africanus]
MRLMGNERQTADIDVLIESSERDSLLAYLRKHKYLVRANNRTAIQFDNSIEPVPLDVLVEVADGPSLRRFLRPDVALGIKLRTCYLRADDEHGEHKSGGDLTDIYFLLDFILEQGLKVGDDCAQKIQISYLNMYYLRDRMNPANFEKMKACGVQKLLKPWAEHDLEQRELYEAMAGTDIDPFTYA